MQGCSICAFKLNYLYFCDYSGSLDIILALYGIIRLCTYGWFWGRYPFEPVVMILFRIFYQWALFYCHLPVGLLDSSCAATAPCHYMHWLLRYYCLNGRLEFSICMKACIYLYLLRQIWLLMWLTKELWLLLQQKQSNYSIILEKLFGKSRLLGMFPSLFGL